MVLSLLLLAVLPANAGKPATFTTNPAKWVDVDLRCTSDWVSGPALEAKLGSGELVGPMQDQSDWPARLVARPADTTAGELRVALASTTRGPVDLAVDRGAVVGYAAAFAELVQFAPKLRVGPAGEFAGIESTWDGAKQGALIVRRLGANGWEGMSMLDSFRTREVEPWAASAEAAAADRWQVLSAGWVGREVATAPFQTEGGNGTRTWTAEISTGCGAKVKSCAALRVVSQSLVASDEPGDSPRWSFDEARAWVDPRTMQLYGWSESTYRGYKDDSGDGMVTGEGRRVTCAPR